METIEEFKEKYSNLEVNKSNVCSAFIELIKDYNALKVKMTAKHNLEIDEYVDELVRAVTNSEMTTEEYKIKLEKFMAAKNYDAEIAKLYLVRREIELKWGIGG